LIPEREVWWCAQIVVKHYSADAMLEAAARADRLLEVGDIAGASTWHRILNAIEWLRATKPGEGETVQ
jgi:hypothetical protein